MKIGYSITAIVALCVGLALGWGLSSNYTETSNTSKGLSESIFDEGMQTCSATGGEGDADEGVFELDGTVYTAADLPSGVKNMIFEAKQNTFHQVDAIVREIAVRIDLAKKKNKTVDLENIPALSDLLGIKAPTDAELKEVFQQHSKQLPPGTTFDQIKDRLGPYVAQQKAREFLQLQIKSLEASDRLKVLVRAPVPHIVKLELEGFPSKGSKSADMTLVEVSDYLCPHCQKMQPEVESLVKEFTGKMRFVQVNFALRPDGLSGALSRGAYCSSKQSDDLFWRFHGLAFKVTQKDSTEYKDGKGSSVVTNIAKDAGVDLAKFNQCLDSDEARKYVENSVERMSKVGVSGTPTFFLNGKKLHVHKKSIRELVVSEIKKAG